MFNKIIFLTLNLTLESLDCYSFYILHVFADAIYFHIADAFFLDPPFTSYEQRVEIDDRQKFTIKNNNEMKKKKTINQCVKWKMTVKHSFILKTWFFTLKLVQHLQHSALCQNWHKISPTIFSNCLFLFSSLIRCQREQLQYHFNVLF